MNDEFIIVDFEGEALPARACYAVKELPKNAKVEIEAIAVCSTPTVVVEAEKKQVKE
jgi:enamine deaminase RidA (YjgF/YER057c/UK114 family)